MTDMKPLEDELTAAKDEVLEIALVHGLALLSDFKSMTTDIREFSQKRYNAAAIRYTRACTAHAEALGKNSRVISIQAAS